MRDRSPWRRRIGVLLGVAILVVAVILVLRIRAMVLSEPLPPGSDAPSYLLAATALREGTDPYDLATWAELAIRFNYPALLYLYPPLLAVLSIPLTYLPLASASQVFVLLALIAAAAFCLIIRRSVGWITAIVMVFLFLPTWATIYFGQIGFLIAILLQLAIEGIQADRPMELGISLVLGTLLKITPGAGLILLLQRRYRAGLLAGFATAAIVVLLTLPYASLQRWIEGSLMALRMNWHVWWLASWTGILTYRLPAPYGEALSAILGLTALSYTLIRLRKLPADLALCALMLLPLLFARIVWGHHAVTALPVLVVLWRRSPGNRLLVVLAWFVITLLDFHGLAPALTLCWIACVWPEQTRFLDRLYERLETMWTGLIGTRAEAAQT